MSEKEKTALFCLNTKKSQILFMAEKLDKYFLPMPAIDIFKDHKLECLSSRQVLPYPNTTKWKLDSIHSY